MCVLYEPDKLLIGNDSELTDKHIQFAQSIIKCQHSLMGGLYFRENLTHEDAELPTQ